MVVRACALLQTVKVENVRMEPTIDILTKQRAVHTGIVTARKAIQLKSWMQSLIPSSGGFSHGFAILSGMMCWMFATSANLLRKNNLQELGERI